MKKELLWAACMSVVLGAGVLFLAGGTDAEGGPWKPLNDQLETALAVQEGTLEGIAKADGKDSVVKQESSDGGSNALPTAKTGAEKTDNVVDVEAESVSQPLVANPDTANSAQQAVAVQSAVSANPTPIHDGKIHINTADVAMLMELPGIGEKKAQAILDYRTQNGPFQNVTDIVKVKGIGAKMLEKMLPDLAL